LGLGKRRNGCRLGCPKPNIVSATAAKAAVLVSFDAKSLDRSIDDEKTHVRLVQGVPVNLQIQSQTFHGIFLDPRLVLLTQR